MNTPVGVCPKCGYRPVETWRKIVPAERRHALTIEEIADMVKDHLMACNGKHPSTWEKSVKVPR